MTLFKSVNVGLLWFLLICRFWLPTCVVPPLLIGIKLKGNTYLFWGYKIKKLQYIMIPQRVFMYGLDLVFLCSFWECSGNCFPVNNIWTSCLIFEVWNAEPELAQTLLIDTCIMFVPFLLSYWFYPSAASELVTPLLYLRQS